MTDSVPPPVAKAALPRSDRDQIHWLQLIRSHRVGPATFLKLMAEFGSATAALAALPEIAAAAGVKDYTPFPEAEAEREFTAGRKAGARLICLGAADYPAALQDISDAPPVLWAKGQAALLQRPSLALVGARNASSLGTRMAKLLAGELGRTGYVIASGLARGIDTAAHLASLSTGTIAVMAGGVDFIYPTENHGLAEKLLESGLMISEQPIGLVPQARHFPRRNRIISGISQAVIVVEGAAKSGSLITAREALDQGREVMAVPGHPLDSRASGCNILIRDGALLVRSAKDITDALRHEAQPVVRDLFAEAPAQAIAAPKSMAKPSVRHALDLSRRILSLLGPSPIAEDQLIRELDLPAQTIASELVNLELEGKLARQSGGMLARAV